MYSEGYGEASLLQSGRYGGNFSRLSVTLSLALSLRVIFPKGVQPADIGYRREKT